MYDREYLVKKAAYNLLLAQAYMTKQAGLKDGLGRFFHAIGRSLGDFLTVRRDPYKEGLRAIPLEMKIRHLEGDPVARREVNLLIDLAKKGLKVGPLYRPDIASQLGRFAGYLLKSTPAIVLYTSLPTVRIRRKDEVK